MKTVVSSMLKAESTSALLDVVPRIKKGLPVTEFDALREMLGLSDAELAKRIGVSIPTLYRRRRSKGRLGAEASDRMMRFARLFGMALKFFEGNAEAARRWFARPASVLGGANPLEMASTELGARLVEQFIGRLEHGVYT